MVQVLPTLTQLLPLPLPLTLTLALTSRVVSSRAELEGMLHTASLYRTTDATNCNEVSSRSHAVLQLRLETTARFGEVPERRMGLP